MSILDFVIDLVGTIAGWIAVFSVGCFSFGWRALFLPLLSFLVMFDCSFDCVVPNAGGRAVR